VANNYAKIKSKYNLRKIVFQTKTIRLPQQLPMIVTGIVEEEIIQIFVVT
jgi:hypothetical protein